ncbi:conjugal transfer protein TraD [Burkholderia cenocepacia]|uniref:conjugal transfer protein TraD n=1 Tax=Burkholderia cenocepacia TaxID=95486 RepID=UPI00265009A8|nr:conjugal transfer protein TraD [Burkholderia cenocepacia]MDN7694609.1 conjugal transfer protein TraD [Burkholderia cenocepacia]
MTTEWIENRVAYIRGLKKPTDRQRMLLLLTEKRFRSADDQRKLDTLITAEKAEERAQKARAKAARVVTAVKQAERKARNHELYKAAGLLILAGLVDSATGKPLRDRGELLGALLDMANREHDEKTVNKWKRAGDARLEERAVTEKAATMLYVDAAFEQFGHALNEQSNHMNRAKTT